MSELKPCPFCGGEALLFGSYERGYFVECHDCFSKTSNFGSEGKAESIVAWNTRAERTCTWEHPQGVNGWVGYMVCSACGEKYDECVTDTARYCPNCGAKVVDE